MSSGVKTVAEIAVIADTKQAREEMKKLAEATGKTAEQVEKDTDRDLYMSAQEAVTYGVVDEVFNPGNRKKRSLEA